METVITIVTCLLIGMCIWSSVIAIADARMMFVMRTFRGSFRKTDLVQFSILACCSTVGMIVLFVHPGLIYKVPAGILALEIASIPTMFYFTELMMKNINRVRQIRG